MLKGILEGLTEDDISKWDWEDISDDVRDISRIQHLIDLGAEQGFTYKSGDARYSSKVTSKIIKDYSDTLDYSTLADYLM